MHFFVCRVHMYVPGLVNGSYYLGTLAGRLHDTSREPRKLRASSGSSHKSVLIAHIFRLLWIISEEHFHAAAILLLARKEGIFLDCRN